MRELEVKTANSEPTLCLRCCCGDPCSIIVFTYEAPTESSYPDHKRRGLQWPAEIQIDYQLVDLPFWTRLKRAILWVLFNRCCPAWEYITLYRVGARRLRDFLNDTILSDG